MAQYRLQRLADEKFDTLDIYECVFASDILTAFKSHRVHYHIVTHQEPVFFFEKASAAVAAGAAGAGDNAAKEGPKFVRYGVAPGSYIAVMAEMAFEELMNQINKLSGDQKISALSYVDESHSELYRAPVRHP
jgi:hypothetical protein